MTLNVPQNFMNFIKYSLKILGAFPWKTVIFAALLIFTTIQALNMVDLAS